MDGRFEWLTSPYPKPVSLKNRLEASAEAENVENLHPASASASSTTSGADSVAGSSIEISSNSSIENNPSSSKHTSLSSNSSDEQICDPNNQVESEPEKSNSSSSDSNQGPSSPSNQRKSSRPINRKSFHITYQGRRKRVRGMRNRAPNIFLDGNYIAFRRKKDF